MGILFVLGYGNPAFLQIQLAKAEHQAVSSSLTHECPISLKYFRTSGLCFLPTISFIPTWVNARSWLKVGQRVSKPKLGDVVIFWRDNPNSWKGHVAFFVRETKNWVYVLGGNQNNQVKISAYPKHRLLQYRSLT